MSDGSDTGHLVAPFDAATTGRPFQSFALDADDVHEYECAYFGGDTGSEVMYHGPNCEAHDECDPLLALTEVDAWVRMLYDEDANLLLVDSIVEPQCAEQRGSEAADLLPGNLCNACGGGESAYVSALVDAMATDRNCNTLPTEDAQATDLGTEDYFEIEINDIYSNALDSHGVPYSGSFPGFALPCQKNEELAKAHGHLLRDGDVGQGMDGVFDKDISAHGAVRASAHDVQVEDGCTLDEYRWWATSDPVLVFLGSYGIDVEAVEEAPAPLHVLQQLALLYNWKKLRVVSRALPHVPVSNCSMEVIPTTEQSGS